MMALARNLILSFGCAALLTLGWSQTTPSKPISPAEAKDHVGGKATVCGKVVDARVGKYGLAGHGKPVSLYLDQPGDPNPLFYFVAFAGEGGKPEKVSDDYQGKQVCVTGKIASMQNTPFILAPDPTQIEVQTGAK